MQITKAVVAEAVFWIDAAIGVQAVYSWIWPEDRTPDELRKKLFVSTCGTVAFAAITYITNQASTAICPEKSNLCQFVWKAQYIPLTFAGGSAVFALRQLYRLHKLKVI